MRALQLLLSMAMLPALAGCPAAPHGNGATAPGAAATLAGQDPAGQDATGGKGSNGLAGSSWRLIEGLAGVDLSAVEVSLRFEGSPAADGSPPMDGIGGISGSGGCNSYQADLIREGGSVRIGPIGATKRGCPGLRGEAESRYFQALSQVHAIARDGARLLLERSDGTPLEFAPAATQ